jgi:transposase, IS5 family
MATRSLVLRESDPQPSLWEALLPDEVKRLPAELVAVDAFLDECFIAPWRALFSKGLGRPSVPVDTLLRLLYLEDRYQLGYESLCREIADSISCRGSAVSAWTGRCPTRPRWSSWCAGPVRK